MLRTMIVTGLAIIAVADFASHTASARDLSADAGRVRVRYADLDLNGPRGAAVMTARIHSAARSICGGDGTSYADMAQRHLAQACIRETSALAAARLGAPLVTALISGAGASTLVMAAR